MNEENNLDSKKGTETSVDLDYIKNLENDTAIDSGKNNESSESLESDSLNKGGFYTPDSSDTQYKVSSNSRKKAGIGIGVIALLTGGGFGLFGLFAQPLQFIQMSSMLRNFHFSDSENLGDERMTKLGRYIKYNGDQRTRLSVLGNKYANRLETRLNKSGLKSTYDGPRSTFSGYRIDPKETFAKQGELIEVDGKTPQQRITDLSAKYGIDTSHIDIGTDGVINIKTDGLSTLETKRLIRTSLEEAGYSKIGASIRSRIMGKRAGVSWNPIKNLDTKITASVEARIKDFFDVRKKRISNGVDTDLFTVKEDPNGKTDTNGDSTPDSNPDTKTAADNANDLTSGSGTPEENIKSKLGKVGAGIAIVGVVCAVKGLAEQYDYIKHDNVVLPLMRLGVEGLAVGNQVVTGQNLDPVQMDAMTKLMYDPETQTSWRNAKSIQYEAGENPTGPDIGSEAKLDANGNVFTQVLNSVPGLDSVCKVASSWLGNAVDIGMTLLSGPIQVVTDQFQSVILGKLGASLIGWLAGNPININVAGANYGNYINYGARLAANDSFISGGGRQLTSAEVAELRNNRIQDENYAFSKKSTLAKLFDATDYRTPLGKFFAEQAPNPQENIARITSIFPKTIASLFGSGVNNLFTSKAAAAESYDYGFPKYGFSVSEINSSTIENPFENDAVVESLLNAKADEINKATNKCFGINIVKRKLGIEDVWTPESTGTVPKYVDITNDPKCTDTSEEFLRIRMWIHDTQMMSSYACFEDGADNTCAEFGLAPDNNQNSGSVMPSSIDCKGYIKLSSMPAILVNGMPTNTELVPYNSTVKSVCEKVKNQCSVGVSDTMKILCAALEFHDSWYGSNSSKSIGGVSSLSYYYGIDSASSAISNPSRWYDSRRPGINSTNMLDCSSLTTVAVYRAYGYSEYIGCSGNWGEPKRPDLFRNISWEEVKPGDLLTYSQTCNTESGFGHVAIAASTVAPDGSFAVFEQASYGSTAHFRATNKRTWGTNDDNPTFKGNLSRWIGTGVN